MKGKDTIHYLSQQTTVCFTCSALQRGSPILAANSFHWSIGDSRLSLNQTALEGRVFPNGTLLIVNSSQTFSTDNATKISCTNSSRITESQTATIYLGGDLISVCMCRNIHMWFFCTAHTTHPMYLTHAQYKTYTHTHTHTH